MKIEYFEWDDACSIDEWHNPLEEPCEPAVCYAAGIVVAETDKAVKIAASVTNFGDACCAITIPLVNIKKRKLLKEIK